jgi:L-lactate dehydrogenase complex protein LldG
MTSRDEILARVRQNQPAAQPLPIVPAFDAGRPTSLDMFKTSLGRMGGKIVALHANGNLDALIAKLFPDAKVVCSATPEATGSRPMSGIKDPRDLSDVDVGVFRASSVVETGSLWLSEAQFIVNALGFLAQHLVVLLDPAALVADMHRAYQHPAFRTAKYAVFMTGPSATADIEGVLIHGAQGIRTMTVIPVAAP